MKSKTSVLLVDDQLSTLIILRTILNHAGYAVVECNTGYAALAALREFRFALALVDLCLPDLSGLDLVSQARAFLSTLPAILGITGSTSSGLAEQAKAAGMCGLLRKPLAYEQTINAVEIALNPISTRNFAVSCESVVDPRAWSEFRHMGDDDRIRDFVKQSLVDAESCIRQLRIIEANPRGNTLETAAQALLGVALTLGARRLAAAATDLVSAGSHLSSGDPIDSAERLSRLLEEVKQWFAHHLGQLTRRERECLRLASVGMSSKRIAVELAVSDATVNFHIQNAVSKLNATDRVQAVAIAVKEGAI